MKSLTLILAACVLFLSGCATITRGLSTTIDVSTPDCEKPTTCSFSNKKGTWTVTVPGQAQVMVKKSDDPLQISCKDADGAELHTTAESRMSAMAAGNIIFGGGIGAIIDARTDAHRVYPKSVIVPLCSKDGGGMQLTYPTFEDNRTESQKCRGIVDTSERLICMNDLEKEKKEEEETKNP